MRIGELLRMTTIIRFVPVDLELRRARFRHYSCGNCAYYNGGGCAINAYARCRANTKLGAKPRYFEEIESSRKEEAGKAS